MLGLLPRYNVDVGVPPIVVPPNTSVPPEKSTLLPNERLPPPVNVSVPVPSRLPSTAEGAALLIARVAPAAMVTVELVPVLSPAMTLVTPAPTSNVAPLLIVTLVEL